MTRELFPGDVVVIPAGVKHWHGAAKDSWFTHLAVEVPGENAGSEWLEPVGVYRPEVDSAQQVINE